MCYTFYSAAGKSCVGSVLLRALTRRNLICSGFAACVEKETDDVY
jgi:hypothetical protein